VDCATSYRLQLGHSLPLSLQRDHIPFGCIYYSLPTSRGNFRYGAPCERREDFGNLCFYHLVGLGWSFGLDMWSVGCVLAKLLKGRPLFTPNYPIETLWSWELFLGTKMPQSLDEPRAKQHPTWFKVVPGIGYVLKPPSDGFAISNTLRVR
jgi:hypothetical protein